MGARSLLLSAVGAGIARRLASVGTASASSPPLDSNPDRLSLRVRSGRSVQGFAGFAQAARSALPRVLIEEGLDGARIRLRRLRSPIAIGLAVTFLYSAILGLLLRLRVGSSSRDLYARGAKNSFLLILSQHLTLRPFRIVLLHAVARAEYAPAGDLAVMTERCRESRWPGPWECLRSDARAACVDVLDGADRCRGDAHLDSAFDPVRASASTSVMWRQRARMQMRHSS